MSSSASATCESAEPPSPAALAALALVLAVYAAAALSFGAEQSLWVDETTQLTGLALPLGELTPWLAGGESRGLGVPPDRMPPASYLLGKIWAAVFGLSEGSLRFFGVVAVAAALPPMWLAGRRLGGTWGGVLAAAVLLLSAQVVVTANEIRAYPLFLSASAWLVYAFVVLASDPGARRRAGPLAGFAAAALAACYLHYFGLVAAGALGAALLAVAAVQRAGVGAVLLLGAVIGLGCAGLVPFVAAAVEMSGGRAAAPQPPGQALQEAARLALRLVISPPMLAVPGAALAAAGAAGALCLLAVGAAARSRSPSAPAVLGLAGALAVALPVLAALSVAVAGFTVLAPHYNLWMLPVLACVMAAALGMRGRARPIARGPAPVSTARGAAPVVARRSALPLILARGAALVLVGANLAGTAALVRHAPLYTHGPEDWIAAMIDAPDRTRVLHDADGPWGSIYFSLFYRHGADLAQISVAADGGLTRITPDGLRPAPPRPGPDGVGRTLRITARDTRSAELAALARDSASCAALLRAAAEEATRCAFRSARVAEERP